MTEQEAALEPCPFCDAVDPELNRKNIAVHSGPSYWRFYVRCSKCCARTGYFRSLEGAFAAWNHRAPREAAPGEKGLEELIARFPVDPLSEVEDWEYAPEYVRSVIREAYALGAVGKEAPHPHVPSWLKIGARCVINSSVKYAEDWRGVELEVMGFSYHYHIDPAQGLINVIVHETTAPYSSGWTDGFDVSDLLPIEATSRP